MALALEKDDSVYDFLYVDSRRIGLLLSQLGQDGVLTELTRATDTSSETGGGLDLKVVKTDIKEGEKVSLTRRFDPQWLMPLRFLDLAQEMVVREIDQVRVGQLSLVSGSLAILDLGTLKALWDMPGVQKLMAAGMKDHQVGGDRNAQARAEAQKLALLKMITDILKVLPHGVQARLRTTAKDTVWCGLQETSLIGSAADLLLKHGAALSGTWNILGILDALPDSASDDASAALIAELQGEVAHMVATLAPVARSSFGRPAQAYGMTPLLIFRRVLPKPQQ